MLCTIVCTLYITVVSLLGQYSIWTSGNGNAVLCNYIDFDVIFQKWLYSTNFINTLIPGRAEKTFLRAGPEISARLTYLVCTVFSNYFAFPPMAQWSPSNFTCVLRECMNAASSAHTWKGISHASAKCWADLSTLRYTQICSGGAWILYGEGLIIIIIIIIIIISITLYLTVYNS